MIDGFPLSFFLPLMVHALAALTTGVTGVITFWVLPTAIALPFLVVSLSRFAPKTVRYTRRDPAAGEVMARPGKQITK